MDSRESFHFDRDPTQPQNPPSLWSLDSRNAPVRYTVDAKVISELWWTLWETKMATKWKKNENKNKSLFIFIFFSNINKEKKQTDRQKKRNGNDFGDNSIQHPHPEPTFNFQSINDGLWEEAIGCGHNVLYIYKCTHAHTHTHKEKVNLLDSTSGNVPSPATITTNFISLFYSTRLFCWKSHTHTQNVISWRTMLGWAGEKS